MPNGLDYSYILPAPNGNVNPSFEHSNAPSTDNLHVGASKLMHVDSNLNLTGIDPSPTPRMKHSGELSAIKLKENE
jgi:hypothetical protein